MPQLTGNKIVSIQYLRGLAALGVVFCHYGRNLVNYPKLAAFFFFGYTGVFLFFLISGFIIVYALVKSNYSTAQFFTFLLKRSIRIDPSYYTAILLTLTLSAGLHAIPSFRGKPFVFIPAQFIAHLFYYLPFTSYRFYNRVFWTLSVEFQFYLLIGLLYFLTSSKLYKHLFLALFSLSCLVLWPRGDYVLFSYAPIFATGILLADLYHNRKWVNFIFPSLTLLLVGYKFGIPVFILLLLSSLVILYYEEWIKPLNFIGDISYSLYLTHGMVYLVATGAIKRFGIDQTRYELWILFVEVGVAILIAYGFYLLIERPSLKFSKHFFYKNKANAVNSCC